MPCVPSFFLGGRTALPKKKNRSELTREGKARKWVGSSGGEKWLWCLRAQKVASFEKIFLTHFVSNGMGFVISRRSIP